MIEFSEEKRREIDRKIWDESNKIYQEERDNFELAMWKKSHEAEMKSKIKRLEEKIVLQERYIKSLEEKIEKQNSLK